MHRFYLPPEHCQRAELLLSERESHHALDVLRIRAGEKVAVLDGVGHEFLCTTQDHSGGKLRLKVLSSRYVAERSPRITLVQALPKAKLIETVVEKATELGAHRIRPVFTERVISRFGPEDAKAKQRKWQAVAVESIKQCGNLWVPAVEQPAGYREALADLAQVELPLIASLQPESRHPREYFKQFVSEHGRKPQSVCVWIGPEGDFTAEEVAEIQAAGARPITLGPLVLRTDTATCYCLSVLNYEAASAE